MRAAIGLLLAALALGAAACSSGGAQGNAGAVPQPQCFVKATGGGYAAFTVQVLGTSDCTNIMNGINNSLGVSFGMAAAKVSETNPTGSELCSGTIGNYDVMAYGAAGDTGICTYLGLPVVP
jgi:hypothetical protein